MKSQGDRTENIVGRFWKDSKKENTFNGYIELGILGKIKNCRITQSPKRSGYEGDCDMILLVENSSTPIGLSQFIKQNIVEALFEVDDGPGEDNEQESVMEEKP